MRGSWPSPVGSARDDGSPLLDRDCDRLSWLTRVATPAEVGGAMPSLPESDLPASPDNV
jgi:hypothetical protein